MRLLSGRHMRRLPRSLQRTGLAKKLYAHLPALAGMTPAVTMLSAAAIPNRAFSAEALPPPSTVRVHAPLEKNCCKSGTSKPQPAIAAWAIFSSIFSLLVIAAVSRARLQKMPANSAFLAPRRARNHSYAYKIGISRLAQCPMRAILGTVAQGNT